MEKNKKEFKGTTVFQDLSAGIDPTGVLTFRNASKNEDNHGLHKGLGVIGGFAGGYTISTLLGAAGLAGLAKSTGKGPLGKMLMDGAKDSLGAMSPARVRHAFTEAKKSSVLTDRATQASNAARDLKKNPSMGTPEFLAKLKADSKKLDSDRLEFIAKNKFGDTPERSISRSIGVLGGATAGGLGGILGAAAADAQYDLAREIKSTYTGEPTGKKFVSNTTSNRQGIEKKAFDSHDYFLDKKNKQVVSGYN